MNRKRVEFPRVLKTGATLLVVLRICMSLTGCSGSGSSDTTYLGEWYKKSSYEGVARSGAVSFVIDGKAYVGTGYDGDKWLKDFYMYDADKNNWFKRADFPGVARNAAVAFAANGKGYVGTGSDGTTFLKDFYEYDPIGDTWTQIADFPGLPRYEAAAFAIDNVGYVTSGYGGADAGTSGNYLKDMYAYNAVTGEWSQKASYSGDKLVNAFAFAIDGKGYVGGGMNNGVLNQQFWEYDPINDIWNVKNDLQDDAVDTDTNDSGYTIARQLGVTFVIEGKGYVLLGTRATLDAGVWEYNPSTDTWTQKNSFEGSVRDSAVGFALGNYGYVATGRSSSLRFDDLWMFDPTAVDVD
jgi:N-acetylneuraminic acid mutarotase